MTQTLSLWMDDCIARVTKLQKSYLENPKTAAPLLEEAMHYSVNNGGKMLRPLLVYATGNAFDTPQTALDIPAFAIELIHAYSLIHDDLPCMDNADLRRGKPSCHKKFDEVTAVLAGDALQPLAFEVIASHENELLRPAQRVKMISALSHAAGMQGMVAGQILDMQTAESFEGLKQIHALKTGKMISACIKLGIIAANSKNTLANEKLISFAEKIGLLYQIQDDLLDLESNEHNTGKPKGIDAANNKMTFPNILGVEKSKTLTDKLYMLAKEDLKALESNAQKLNDLTDFIFQRKK